MIEAFPIAPATGRGLWIIIVAVMALFVIVGGMLVATAHGSSATRFELSEDGLRIRGDLYGRLIPASALRGDAARVVDLTQERELARSAGVELGEVRTVSDVRPEVAVVEMAFQGRLETSLEAAT